MHTVRRPRTVVVAVFVLALIAVGLGQRSASAGAFVDVDPEDYFADAVDWMVDQGITQGTSPSTFSPDDPVTRAQAAAFLHRFGFEWDGVDHPFTDVPSESYYEDAVGWLMMRMITQGVSATEFGPDLILSRAQIATFLYRYAGEPEVSASSGFSDVPDGMWFSDPIAWMVEQGITQGTSASTFSPEQTVTRAQFATFLWRYVGEPAVGEVMQRERQPVLYDCELQTVLYGEECTAIVALHQHTDGRYWTNTGGWLKTPNPCGWLGLDCEGLTVTAIRLPDNNLVGTLPDDITMLTSLRVLELNSNSISGPIPSSDFDNLDSLEELDLQHNELTGSIPSGIDQLTSLQFLTLNSNSLNGSFPAGITSLVELVTVRLDNNRLTGSLPSDLGSLTKVQRFDVSSNLLSGSVPTSIGSMADLQFLRLQDNGFTGTLPSELGSLSNLLHLVISGNDFAGSIPSTFSDLSAATWIDISYNQLEGAVPPSMQSLPDLATFTLRGNGCFTAVDGILTLWLDGMDPLWDDGCP